MILDTPNVMRVYPLILQHYYTPFIDFQKRDILEENI
jgi:hypothetical protein